MTKKRKVITFAAVIAAVAAIVTFLVISIFYCALIGGPELQNNGDPYLFSIALFGKLEVAGVDKIVISSENKSLTITDQALVDEIVAKTKVASWAYNSGCGCCERRDLKIDLYRGNWLVRSMDWLEDDIVKVYDCDLTHWVFPVEVQFDRPLGGYALLSEELEMQLHEMFMNAQ